MTDFFMRIDPMKNTRDLQWVSNATLSEEVTETEQSGCCLIILQHATSIKSNCDFILKNEVHVSVMTALTI